MFFGALTNTDQLKTCSTLSLRCFDGFGFFIGLLLLFQHTPTFLTVSHQYIFQHISKQLWKFCKISAEIYLQLLKSKLLSVNSSKLLMNCLDEFSFFKQEGFSWRQLHIFSTYRLKNIGLVGTTTSVFIELIWTSARVADNRPPTVQPLIYFKKL